MKLVLALVLLASSTLASAANITKSEAIRLAATALVDKGDGAMVEGCSHLEGASNKKLIACVMNATGMTAGFQKMQKTSVLKRSPTFRYLDTSGDCALAVKVDAKSGEVEMNDWTCY